MNAHRNIYFCVKTRREFASAERPVFKSRASVLNYERAK